MNIKINYMGYFGSLLKFVMYICFLVGVSDAGKLN